MKLTPLALLTLFAATTAPAMDATPPTATSATDATSPATAAVITTHDPVLAAFLPHLHPGMTRSDVLAAIASASHGQWRSTHCTATADHIRIGPGLALVLAYNHLLDDHDSPRADAHLARIEVVDIADRCPGMDPVNLAALRLIQDAPQVDGWHFDPAALLRCVNGLMPLGRDRVIQVMRQYEDLDPADRDRREHDDFDDERLYLIARLLFIPDAPARTPALVIPGADGPALAKNNPDWPLYPLALHHDLPIMLVANYVLTGFGIKVSDYIDPYINASHLRTTPLIPTDSPLKIVADLQTAPAWLRLDPKKPDDPYEFQCEVSITRGQALIAANDPRAQTLVDRFNDLITTISDDDADTGWAHLLADPLIANERWNPTTGCFQAAPDTGPGPARP